MSAFLSNRRPPGRAAATIALIAEVTATLAVALWLGGMLALGAFAAPEVFGQLERPVAGSVMGTIFANFDRMVLVLIAVLVVSEAARVLLEGVRGRLGLARLCAAAVLAGLALISALYIGPRINEMFHAGVMRGVGQAGVEMDRLHDWATRLGKLAFAVAAAWLTLGIIGHRRCANKDQL